jgi:ribonuclease HII
MPSSRTGRPAAWAPSKRARRARRKRTSRHLFTYDRKLCSGLLAGADEAGRGSLAGPLVAAAVLFDYELLGSAEQRLLRGLNDSKQHTRESREALYPRVLRVARRVTVITRCAGGIDGRGLHKTNLAALREALRRVCTGVDGEVLCVVDGFSVQDFGRPQRAIVDGDATSAAIAAASIVAKVTRDRYMHHADSLYPEWSFKENVGYSTPEHRAAIRRHGVSPLHRMSFQSLAYEQLAF